MIGGDGGIHACDEGTPDMSTGRDGDGGLHSGNLGNDGVDLLWGGDDAGD